MEENSSNRWGSLPTLVCVLDQSFGFGGFTETFEKSALDYLYFSAASYTTLGLSRFEPTGNLKIVTALEALTGSLMITWSASFGYKAIKNEGFWKKLDEEGESEEDLIFR